MPFPSTESLDRPARTLDRWWLGPIVLAESEGKLTAITTMRRGDADGVSSLPADSIDLRTMDLVAEFPKDLEALQAIGQVMQGIEIIASKLMDVRSVR